MGTEDYSSHKIIQIDLNTTQKIDFSIKNSMVLLPFELSSRRVIVGESYEVKNTPYDVSYLNEDGFNSIESASIE